jgi:broad specificity phosphatase PhoE
MTKYLIRHAQSSVNIGELAFGNLNAPLTDFGRQIECPDLRLRLEDLGFLPSRYTGIVATSEFARSKQTAEECGYANMLSLSILNEIGDEKPFENNIKLVIDHRRTGAIDHAVADRASQFLDQIGDPNSVTHNIDLFFSHGYFIAAIKAEINKRWEIYMGLPVFFPDVKRGLIPERAEITPIDTPVTPR